MRRFFIISLLFLIFIPGLSIPGKTEFPHTTTRSLHSGRIEYSTDKKQGEAETINGYVTLSPAGIKRGNNPSDQLLIHAVPAELFFASHFFCNQVLFHKKKNYLFFIYPSHNFW